MKQKIQYLQIGYTTKSFGVKGELKVMINETIDEEILSELDHLFLDYDGQYVPFFIEYSDDTSVKLEEIDSPEEANKLGNLPIYLSEYQIDINSLAGQSINTSELANFKINNSNGHYVGEILKVEEFPSQMMLIVKQNLTNKEIMIPLVESWVLEFDEASKSIKMEIPNGLLHLEEEE